MLFSSNLLILALIGYVIVRTILFPYSMDLVTGFIDGEGSARYNEEFKNLMIKFYLIIRHKLLSNGDAVDMKINCEDSEYF